MKRHTITILAALLSFSIFLISLTPLYIPRAPLLLLRLLLYLLKKRRF